MQGYALGVMLWPQIGQYFSLTSAMRAQEGHARFDGSDSPSIDPQCLHFRAPAMIGSRQNGQGMCGFMAAPSRGSAGIAAATPLGRLGQPEDIADIVLFLASPASRWVNGRTIIADGGLI